MRGGGRRRGEGAQGTRDVRRKLTPTMPLPWRQTTRVGTHVYTHATDKRRTLVTARPGGAWVGLRSTDLTDRSLHPGGLVRPESRLGGGIGGRYVAEAETKVGGRVCCLLRRPPHATASTHVGPQETPEGPGECRTRGRTGLHSVASGVRYMPPFPRRRKSNKSRPGDYGTTIDATASPSERSSALFRLAVDGDPRVVDVARQWLLDPEPHLRQEAIGRLLFADAPDAILIALGSLETEEDPMVRGGVVVALPREQARIECAGVGPGAVSRAS